ncbi:MAG: DNA polymerase I [Firmicutes bacterium]|nr:DNA polymerase I [Bacillota bacterium]
MAKKLVIIDSYSLANRAFFALPPLATSAGLPTNAVYGLAMMLLRLREDSRPDYFAAAFDVHAPTFRHQEYEAYKGQRLKMEDSFRLQLPLIKELLEILKIPVYEKAGFEADDIIGAFATQAIAHGLEVEIVTGDRDAFQLVGPQVKVLYTRKGITEMDRVDPEYIRNRYQLQPGQLVDLKGLMGDLSDNIPGIPGFGEKTAIKYLREFHSIEGIYQAIDRITKLRDRELLLQYKDQAILSRRLAKIKTDLDLAIDFELCAAHRGANPEELLEFCRKYEFSSLVKKLSGGGAEVEVKQLPVIHDPAIILGLNELEDAGRRIRETKVCLIQFLTAEASWRGAAWLGIGISDTRTNWFFPLAPDEQLPEVFRAILADPGIMKIGHDLKRQMALAAKRKISWAGPLEDTLIAGYLVNGGAGGLDLESLSETYLRQRVPVFVNERGKPVPVFSLPAIVPVERRAEIAGGRLAAINRLRLELNALITSGGFGALYHEVELPLIRVLFEMEQAGIPVDTEVLKAFGRVLQQRLQTLQSDIYSLANQEFNINSTKQLGLVLFDNLGLKPPKKNKTGYSTDAEVLETLIDQHPVVAKILEYRQCQKLQTTYIDSLIALVDPESGRVHTTFNQAITTTGRLSSVDPNLQNIPVRSEDGRMIRKAFVAADSEHKLLAADYSQIELRVMAHFSQDPAFMEAFLNGEDIHRFTAAAVYHVPVGQVTKEMRDSAKAVNFGIIYGISGFGLAKNIGVSRKEAEDFIAAYFTKYPGVKKYVEELVETARKTGEARTLLGRIRKLPDLNSRNFTLRSFAERMARNTPIQGTAADIIKLAMVKIKEKLDSQPELGKLLLQVHDELVFEVPESRWRELGRLVKDEMENAVQLSVPLTVDIKIGTNWGEMTQVTV